MRGEKLGEIRPNYYRAQVRATTKHGNAFVDVECFDMIDALGLDFYGGNALKYLWRAGHKEGAPLVDDLRKIKTYVEAMIERAEGDS